VAVSKLLLGKTTIVVASMHVNQRWTSWVPWMLVKNQGPLTTQATILHDCSRKCKMTFCNFVKFLLLLLSKLFKPLLGRTRSRGRCWAAIQLSHRPEPSGHAVHGEVDGLDIGRQHGQRFVLLHHTHKPQRRPYPIYISRSRNVQHRCGSS